MFQSKVVNHLSVLVSFVLILTACGGGAATAAPPEEAPTEAPATEEPTAAPATEEPTAPPVTEEPTVTPEPEVSGNALTFGVWGTTSPNNFCTLSPTTGVDEIWRNRFVGATLLTLDENNQWTPNLAESYEASEDGTTFTFKLDPDVKWHDGEPFTAQDVLFNFGLLLNPDISSYGVLLGDIVENVEAPDDYTVVFHMKRPVAAGEFRIKSDFWNLAQGWIPVPQHLLKDIAPADICKTDWAQSQYVGLGPFKVADFVADDHVIYEPFQDYYLPPSQLEQIRIQFSSDPAFLFESLLAGDFDMAQITPQYIDDIEQNDNFLLPPETSLIAVNKSKWPPADPYVQQALVESQHETFVPYRETLDIGDADLFPLYPEMSAAVDSLRLTEQIQGEFNLSRAVRIVNEGVTVLWMPIGPESARAYANVGSEDEFWATVQANGGLNLGIEVIDELPVAVWAYVTDNGKEIWLIKSDGTAFTTYGEDKFESGMDTVVDIPVAQITIGTTWCTGRIGSFWIKYPCW